MESLMFCLWLKSALRMTAMLIVGNGNSCCMFLFFFFCESSLGFVLPDLSSWWVYLFLNYISNFKIQVGIRITWRTFKDTYQLDLTPRVSGLKSLRWGLRFCVSYRFPGDVVELVPGPHFENHWIWCFLDLSVGEGNGTPLQYSCLENPMDRGDWWAAVHGVTMSRTRLGDFTFTFHFHALEEEMATHSSILAWRIPGTGEPGGLPSMGSHRVRYDWSDLAAAALAGGFFTTSAT